MDLEIKVLVFDRECEVLGDFVLVDHASDAYADLARLCQALALKAERLGGPVSDLTVLHLATI